MDTGVLGQILPLALLDSLSVSTLLVPVLFLLGSGDLRYGNIFRYLAVVALGYLGLGLVLAESLDMIRRVLDGAAVSPAGDVVITVLAFGLLLFAAWYGLLARPDPARGGRLERWRVAVVGPQASVQGVVMIGVVAVLLESVMMFPYLIAIDSLADAGNSWVGNLLSLGIYCVAMVLPAAVLTVGRRLAGDRLEPVLIRTNAWIRRTEREDTAWLIAIAGVLLLATTDLFGIIMG